MGLITTMGQLRILTCDGFYCNKKVESHDEGRVKELALLTGWKNRGDRWACPSCAEKEEAKKKATRSKKPSRRPESTL